ncbi:MAG TPA: pyridoxal-dependent decarboxylase [Methylomirabilota bacterium]|jgi:aromatic-L-amino-acid decarboxylase|nr:pyridoxal-dependent decarboxylase [Methylomirabilota bacterium]
MSISVGPTPHELRHALHEAADWVASYLETVGERPVLAHVAPGDIAAALPQSAPQHGEPLERILQDVDELILPGITHWNHPSFFAYFGISGSGPGIIGELLAAALNVNAMLWRTSPAATELEQRVLAWVAEMLGLPRQWFGEITDTASASTLYALAAAREAAGVQVREEGLAGRSDLPPLAVYTSTQAHSSVDKAAIALGIGRRWTRHIETDAQFRLRPDLLAQAIQHDLAAGVKPFAVVATVGTTSSTSIDPVPAIADVCEHYGLWLHVDAAYGGAAAVVPSHRQVLAGCERADSFVTNPHKWLLTPIDCSLLYTRRPDDLKRAFSLVAEYLRTNESDVVNLMDYGLSLGRRFRALKLWMVLRAYGQEGLARIIKGHIDAAQWLAAQIDREPAWERLAPVPFSTVCFRHAPAGMADLEAHNTRILDAVNASGAAFLSHTKLNGVYALRVAIGNQATTQEHVARLWEQLKRLSRQ